MVGSPVGLRFGLVADVGVLAATLIGGSPILAVATGHSYPDQRLTIVVAPENCRLRMQLFARGGLSRVECGFGLLCAAATVAHRLRVLR